MDSNEEKIRQRAYELWEQSGKAGSEMDFWLQAAGDQQPRQQRTSAPG